MTFLRLWITPFQLLNDYPNHKKMVSPKHKLSRGEKEIFKGYLKQQHGWWFHGRWGERKGDRLSLSQRGMSLSCRRNRAPYQDHLDAQTKFREEKKREREREEEKHSKWKSEDPNAEEERERCCSGEGGGKRLPEGRAHFYPIDDAKAWHLTTTATMNTRRAQLA